MKKTLLTIPVIAALAVFLFIVNPFAVLAATTAAPAQTATQTTKNQSTATGKESVEGSKESAESEHSEDTGVVGLFGLNWKLFLAQLVNFAIVLFVLWKFVFKPVTNNMQARAKKIEDSLVNADRITKEKEEFEHWKAEQMVNARHEATIILTEAKQNAEKLKAQTIEATRTEQQQVLEKAKKDLQAAEQQAVNQAKATIAEMVISSTEKLLKAKIDAKTDSKIIKESLQHLEDKI